MVVGVLSDTHGHLSNQALKALSGVDFILHAGDLDTLDVQKRLTEIAPVFAVRGNMDFGPGLKELPLSQVVDLGETSILMIHDLAKLELDPAAAGYQVVIYGHYHRPELTQRRGVIYLNPGSASFPRMGTRKSLALLNFRGGKFKTEIMHLE